MALVLGRTGTSWYVRQRILSGGLDRPLVTRLVPSAGSAARNMAFIADRQGTTLAAVDPSGLRDETAAFFGRNVFGQLEGASGTGSSSNPETGFTGASTRLKSLLGRPWLRHALESAFENVLRHPLPTQ